MLIVLFAIFVALAIVFYINCEEDWALLLAVCAFIVLCFGVWNINRLLEYQTADEMIAMYEEENTKIESQIDTAVRGYMEFENKTFAELAPGDTVALVSLYPELKSDTLVSSQIATYQKNNQEIKELKGRKISAGKCRWWLYFGKVK